MTRLGDLPPDEKKLILRQATVDHEHPAEGWWYVSLANDDRWIGGVYVEAESAHDAIGQAEKIAGVLADPDDGALAFFTDPDIAEKLRDDQKNRLLIDPGDVEVDGAP